MTATEGRKAAAQRAINELDKLVGMVVQQVNKPSINYRGDAARFAPATAMTTSGRSTTSAHEFSMRRR